MKEDQSNLKWILGILITIGGLFLAYYSIWMDEERETRILHISNIGELNPFLWLRPDEIQLNVNGENLPGGTVRILFFRNGGKKSITSDLFDQSRPITITSAKEIKSASSTNEAIEFIRINPFQLQVKPFFLGRESSFFLHLVLGGTKNTDAKADYSVEALIADTSVIVDNETKLKGLENDAEIFLVYLRTPFALLTLFMTVIFVICSEYIFQRWPQSSPNTLNVFRVVGVVIAICNGENIGHIAQTQFNDINRFLFLGLLCYFVFWVAYFFEQRKEIPAVIERPIPVKRQPKRKVGTSTRRPNGRK